MKAVIALGANLDDPRGSVELALTLLEQSTDLLARSSLYLTKPVGGPPQGDFINAVCIVETELPPQELLNLLHGIEKSMGRVRGEKWGPRVIDLDLITYGDERFVSDELVLPHPLAHERQFVLEPWLEIDPDAQIPGHGRVEDILRREANEEIAFVPTMGALHAGARLSH
ncbi:MAG: 2-amino-4-hydroxy-6-hydroxymethyldihydropteridine diphosphokinase [Actinomycetota bacterium]